MYSRITSMYENDEVGALPNKHIYRRSLLGIGIRIFIENFFFLEDSCQTSKSIPSELYAIKYEFQVNDKYNFN